MDNAESHIGDLVEEVLRQKRESGRDYFFAQKTNKETYYMDDNNNVLVHNSRAEHSIAYLLEIEETKGGKDSCEFSVYMINGSAPIKKVIDVFDTEGSNGNKAKAAELFRRFRDAKDIKAELEKYEKEGV